MKESQHENKLSDDEASKIWTPRFIFQNSPEGHQLKFRPSQQNNIIRLIRNGPSQEGPRTEPDESRVYNSSETEITMKIFYSMKFTCHFLLKYFPFDQQTCFVEVSQEIKQFADFFHYKYFICNQLRLDKDTQKDIELVAGELWNGMNQTLDKFTITNCSIKSNAESLRLVINLQRRSLSFWMSFFIPYIFLILAAEITLFIDEKHFKATITVAVTTNIVMYTLYGTIQEKLPEDSSVKLINVWLLHGLIMPMMVFIILATNELINAIERENENQSISIVKPFNHDMKTPGFNGEPTDKTTTPSADNQKCDKNNHAFMQVCRIAVPIISATFMITFIFVWFSGF